MAHEKLNLNFTRAWASEQAKIEPESGITSVGGLAHRLSELNGPAREIEPVGSAAFAESGRLSLGKFVELSRRRLRLTVEQLAEKADVDLAELLAIEKAEDVAAEPRTVFQLALVLSVKVDPLLELAGLVTRRSVGLSQSAARFAARSESMDVLTKEEEEALNWFVGELTKS